MYSERSLGLSKMALINVAVFLVLKILHYLAYMQKVFVGHLTSDVSKDSKNVEGSIAFIFNVILETVNGFMWFCLVLEMKNIATFIKCVFIDEETAQVCLTMWKRSSAMVIMT